jgi:hypothetical protein
MRTFSYRRWAAPGWLAGVLAYVWSLASPFLGAAAQNESSAPPALRLAILRAKPDSYMVKLADGRTVTLDGTQPGQERLSAQGVLLAVSPEGSLRAKTDVRDLSFDTTIPVGEEVVIQIDARAGRVELDAPPGNAGAVQFRLPDGAWAELGPGTRARFEQLDDKSYYLCGSANVKATNVDGKGFLLSAETPPMTGGPLLEQSGTTAAPELTRLTPLVPVVISGHLPSQLSIEVAGRAVSLAGGAPEKVTLANGSTVNFTLNEQTRMLTWEVERGYFEFQVDGIEGWKAAGLSGQSASQQWDLASRSIALQNLTTSDGPAAFSQVQVVVPGQQTAQVAQGATFQMAQLTGARTFATMATGGAVTMRDRGTGQEFALATQNVVFVDGRPDLGDLAPPPRASRVIVSGGQAGISLAGEFGSPVIPPGAVKTLELSDGTKLEARCEERGKITVKAVEGRVSLATELDQRVAVTLKDGNAIVITVDDRQGTVTFSATPGNEAKGAAYQIESLPGSRSDAGNSPVVELLPNKPLTIALERSAFSSVNEPTRVFYEAAGAGNDSAGLAPVGGPIITARQPGGAGLTAPAEHLDASRIAQPPISTLR